MDIPTLYLLLGFCFPFFTFASEDSCKTISEDAHRIGTYLYPVTPYYVRSSSNAEKIYFYSAPSKKCKIDEFLMNKRPVVAYIEYDNFYFVTYFSPNEDDIDGWLNKDDLIQTGYNLNSQQKLSMIKSAKT